MKLIGGGLIQPHGHPDDVAGLFHNILAAILLPAAQNDRGEQFPGPMHIANLRGELHKPPFLAGVLLLGEIAFADQKLLGELLFIYLAIWETWCRTGVPAGDIMRQMKQVGEPVFDGRGGQDQPVRGVDLADAIADDGVVAFDFGAFVNDTGGKAVLAQVGQGRGIHAFKPVTRFANAGAEFPVAGNGQFGANEPPLVAVRRPPGPFGTQAVRGEQPKDAQGFISEVNHHLI